MSCKDSAFEIGNPCKKSLAGIEELYIFPKSFLEYYRISNTGSKLALIDEILINYDIREGKVNFVKDSGSVTVTSNFNTELNNQTVTTEIKMKVLGTYLGAYYGNLDGDYTVIFKDEYDKYYIVGIEDGASVNYTANTGEKLGDFAGQEYTITVEERPYLFMDKKLYGDYGEDNYVDAKTLINDAYKLYEVSHSSLDNESYVEYTYFEDYIDETYIDNDGYHITHTICSDSLSTDWMWHCQPPFPNMLGQTLMFTASYEDGTEFNVIADNGQNYMNLITNIGNTMKGRKSLEERTFKRGFKINFPNVNNKKVTSFKVWYKKDAPILVADLQGLLLQFNPTGLLVEGDIKFNLSADKGDNRRCLSMTLSLNEISTYKSPTILG